MTNKIIIIAEAGVNHNGNLQLAKEMVLKAKEAGADYVKFQTAVPELVISSIAEKAEYQKETTGAEESQLDMCRAIHLPLEDYDTLKQLCQEVGIGFMSTPFDLVSIDYLTRLKQDYFKIPSGEITNLPYLRRIAAAGFPIIMSTGMSQLEEVRTAIDILTGKSKEYPCESALTKDDIIVLHCNTEYPTPFNHVNLKAMLTLHKELGVRTGYSDHTTGIEVPVAAAALGACVIEKHFTLDRNMQGPDHKASLEPHELKQMVDAIRHIEEALGDGDKKPSCGEMANAPVARKSIVAARDIKKGEIFTEENITVKRPGTGLSPMLWDTVLGKKAVKDFAYDSLIEI
jgi:N,N'-diacetyllegionaminate synthase